MATSGKVKAHKELPFHGKLLWDEDDTLGRRGFATSTGEPFLFQLDIPDGELTMSYNFSADVRYGSCRGLHAISYSAVNKHIYAECVGDPAILEFNVADETKIVFVKQHDGATGAIYEVPDGTYVVASDRKAQKLYVFKPNANGAASSILFTANVPGHPGAPSFFPLDNVKGGADFIACMPLSNNPNANQIEGDEVKCNSYNGCTNASSAQDVANGICLHDYSGSIPFQLKRVSSVVTDDPVCQACNSTAGFVNNSCICTPQCGSCDSNIVLDLSRTGVACIDLSKLVKNEINAATLIPNAGAAKQGLAYGNASECSYTGTYRSSKRGKNYDASVSNYPNESIVIVNMETQKVKCQVNLPGTPSRVVYAPTKPTAVDNVGPDEKDHASNAFTKATSVFSHVMVFGWVLMMVG